MGSTQLRRDQFADDSIDNAKLSNADDYRINHLDVDTSGVFGGNVYASGFVGDGSQLTGVSTIDAHGDLSGLTDDDHPQYARTDGSRTITGDALFAQGITLSDDILVSGHIQNPVGATSGFILTTDDNGQGSWQVNAADTQLKNIVTVSPTNGDFTSIQSAIDSISDASSINRYVIQIGPGIFTENVTMKNFIDLRGVGEKRDVVLTASSGAVIIPTVVTGDEWAISNMTLDSAANSAPVIGDASASTTAGRISDVRIEDCIINVTHTSAQAIELGFGAAIGLIIARNDINVTGANSTGIYIDRITQNVHIIQNRIDSDGDYGLFISANRLDGVPAGFTAVVNTYQNVFVGSATHVALEADSGAGPVTWNSYGDILQTFEDVGTATNKTKNILGHTVNDKDIAALVANQQITTSGIELIADFQADGTSKVKINTTGLLIPDSAVSGYVLTSDADGQASWTNAAVPATRLRDEFSATASQTVFNLTFDYELDEKALHVFVDGQLMRPGASNDYVETDATTITFNSGRTLGSDVVIETLRNAVPVDLDSVQFRDDFTPLTSTSAFDLSSTFVANGKNLQVYIDGQLQTVTDDYTETDTDTVTFVDPVPSGSHVSFLYGKLAVSGDDAASVDGFSASQSYEANKLIALDSNAEFPTAMHVAGSGTFDGDVFATGFSSLSPLPFKVSGVEVARFTDSGFFGIGLTGPEGTLHVHSAAGSAVTVDGIADDFIIENSTAGGMTINSNGSDGSIFFADTSEPFAGFLQYNHTADKLFIGANSTTILTVDGPNTRVGIGQSSPDGILHVQSATAGVITAEADGDELVLEGSANAGLTILSGNASLGSILFGDDGDNNIGFMQYNHSTNSLGIGTNTSTAMTIDSSQNVGIGIGTPDGPLHTMKESAGSVTAITQANGLVVEATTPGISILGANGASNSIVFGSPADNDIGSIVYTTTSEQMIFTTNTAACMKMDSAGAITQVLQPSFLVTAPSNTADVTGDGSSHTMECDTEIYDQGADFNSGSFTFTAPVTGRYLLSANCEWTGGGSVVTEAQFAITTSNRQYINHIHDAEIVQRTQHISVIADMDAADTATVVLTITGGTKTIEVQNSATTAWFSGSLIN